MLGSKTMILYWWKYSYNNLSLLVIILIRRGEFWKYFSYKNLFPIFFSNIITSAKSFRFNVPTIVV